MGLTESPTLAVLIDSTAVLGAQDLQSFDRAEPCADVVANGCEYQTLYRSS